jgi:hypothetical protein
MAQRLGLTFSGRLLRRRRNDHWTLASRTWSDNSSHGYVYYTTTLDVDCGGTVSFHGHGGGLQDVSDRSLAPFTISEVEAAVARYVAASAVAWSERSEPD